eukprot:scaffold29747_cov107-Isochrysis_galbana.AAC.6
MASFTASSISAALPNANGDSTPSCAAGLDEPAVAHVARRSSWIDSRVDERKEKCEVTHRARMAKRTSLSWSHERISVLTSFASNANSVQPPSPASRSADH